MFMNRLWFGDEVPAGDRRVRQAKKQEARDAFT
jgi:hypothetical protein